LDSDEKPNMPPLANALYGMYTDDVKTVAIMMHDALRSYASTKRVNRRDAGGARASIRD
jgi:hypothetical protein